jgi:boron transporter
MNLNTPYMVSTSSKVAVMLADQHEINTVTAHGSSDEEDKEDDTTSCSDILLLGTLKNDENMNAASASSPPQSLVPSPSRMKISMDNDNDEQQPQQQQQQQQPQLFQFMTGMKQDLSARAPLYRDDWSRPKSIVTVMNATMFAFSIQLIPALIFAELLHRTTHGHLATAETLLSSAVIGLLYAVLAGQPLVILGITGPVALLLGTSYSLTEKFNAEYFPFFFWTCFWAGLLHVISAMAGLVSLVWKVTPFTCQIFELFIAITFIYTSMLDLLQPLLYSSGQQPQGGSGQQDEDAANNDDNDDDDDDTRSAQYATLLLGILTCSIAWTLHFAETWMYFTRHVRIFLTSYNTMIACIVVTAISFWPGIDLNATLERVNIKAAPWDWQPTAPRAWIIDPFHGIDTKGIFGAMLPGFMFFLLFIIDHNVSSILTQSPKFNLKKPAAYHWDFFVLGLTFVPCALLGLPPGNGLIPQAPLHCRALCTRQYMAIDVQNNPHGPQKEVVTHCEEQRWSGLGQSLLMLAALSCFTVLSWIPRGVLFGLFLYLGLGALHGNEIWERCLLGLILPKHRPNIPVVTHVSSWRAMQWFTAIQFCCAFMIFAIGQFTDFGTGVACLLACLHACYSSLLSTRNVFVLTFSSPCCHASCVLSGYIYPALLTALVPFRSYILTRWFSEEDLQHLDPFGETEQDYHEEQRAIHEAERKGGGSLDGDDDDEDEDINLDFPNRAMFRNGPDQQLYRRRAAATEHTPRTHDIIFPAEITNDDGTSPDVEMRIVEQEQQQHRAQTPPHEHDK